MLSTLRELPRKGSLQESVLILLHMKQEEINHARIRALAQIMINKEKGPEVFEDYMKSAFPWIETVKKRTNAEQIKLLNEEVKKGAIAIKGPLWQQQRIRSRLKTRVVDRSQASARSKEKLKELYSKLGTPRQGRR